MTRGPEAKIEDYLARQCRMIGGVAEKFTSPNKKGVPDRICQFPFDIIVFVEVKAKGKKPNLLQTEDHRKRRLRGHTVMVIDSKDAVDGFIDGIKETMQKLGDTL